MLEVREREAKLARDREALDLILKKRVNEETDKAREEERMKNAELQKKLDDQARLINEMKRRTEQGSMQMQGEVQELAIEEYLTKLFHATLSKRSLKGNAALIVYTSFAINMTMNVAGFYMKANVPNISVMSGSQK